MSTPGLNTDSLHKLRARGSSWENQLGFWSPVGHHKIQDESKVKPTPGSGCKSERHSPEAGQSGTQKYSSQQEAL